MATTRPKDEEELQKREATGVIRASRFVRAYAKSHEPIFVETLLEITKKYSNMHGPILGEGIESRI